MRERWPRVRLGEVLTQVYREETVDPSRTYKLLGVRWYGDGLFIKDEKTGQQIKASKLYKVQEGDFVYNRLFAWKGSFALAENSVDGCYVSNEFPCFAMDSSRTDRHYLLWYFRRESAWFEALGLSTGATPTSRNRLKEQHFLNLELPLPPLAEQQRIVARIEALASETHEARRLLQQTVEEADSLLVAMAHRADLDAAEKEHAGWRRKPLGEVIKVADDMHKVEPDRSYANLGIYSFARGLFHKPPIDGLATSATSFRRVKTGQFIYSRLFAFEGAYGMVTPDFDGAFVSNEYPTFDCDPTQVRPEFLVAYFKPAHVWRTVATGSKGLGDRRQRVQPAQVLAHEIWIPPMECQEQLVEVHAEVDTLKCHQADTVAELDALLPAVLDRAIRGEL